jgi:hypothetical protein
MYRIKIKRSLKGKVIEHNLGPFEDRDNAEQILVSAWDHFGLYILEAEIIDLSA